MSLFNNSQVKLIDNKESRLVDDLKAEISKKSKLAIAAAYFSIYAYNDLKKQLDSIDELRFIFTQPTFLNQQNSKEQREFFIPRMERERNLYGTDFELRLRNKLTQKAISKECAEWVRAKVQFKSNRTNRPMQQFINIDNKYTYTGITGFTTTDLGTEKGNNLGFFINRLEADASRQYLNMFNEIWNDAEQLEDVKAKILENIETVYAENSPEFIYMITLYNIFKEFLNDITDDVLPKEATGFQNSQIWNKLYAFQKDAARDIIHKLEKFNGCILADSVGLGKTFTALAVIKYYECRNMRVLVLCPKKLQDNWDTFKGNYLNNPVAKDRFNYDVLYHTDLSRTSGKTGDIDLSRVNWGNYDLLVIDESHNFRNGGQTTLDDDGVEHYNRYNLLMEKVIKSGVKTKVLMLSATPVNNRFVDLKYQLELAYEGVEEDINKKLNTKKTLSTIFNNAQKAFNEWSKFPEEKRKTEVLLNMLDKDFFEVLDSVTIARSRKHIEKSYNMEEIGRFPKRMPPINVYPEIVANAPHDLIYKDLFEKLLSLNLSVYSPSGYILPSRLGKYEDKYGKRNGRGISLKGRELGTVKLMVTNLLKRLESSWYSFVLTAESIYKKINTAIKAVEEFENNSSSIYMIDKVYDDDITAYGIDNDRYQIDFRDMDYKSWLRDLKKDEEVLSNLLSLFSNMTPENDNKLNTLKELIRKKIENPLNPGNRKILIFTEWADTAGYLYDNLADYIKQEFGLNTAVITGDSSTSKTNLPHDRKIKMDFNMLLTLFSPVSKDRDKLNDIPAGDIDILIGTDCISEGQNLQDCDYMINFDIHWNPVRIVQRFGRIDRIGSKNDKIQMVNFWPEAELDDYINLTGRVDSRMKAGSIAGAGVNPMQADDPDLQYRREQLNRIKNETPDLEDMHTGVNIMDLGLNEFRLDIVEYIKKHPEIERAAHGMHAVVPATEDMPAGTIFVLKNVSNGEKIDKQNRLHPFYMVYLSESGDVVCDHLSAKKMLDYMRRLCKGYATPIKSVCKQFNEETKDGFDMTHYSDMLNKSIQTIIKVKDESDIESLFSAGGSSLLTTNIQGLDDFELICFIVVK